MSLRRKLLTAYGALALVAVLVAGVTLWTTVQWRDTSTLLREHYERSLLVQRIRASTFQALKEVPDAVTGGDAEAREEFEALLAPAEPDFAEWSDLAHDDAERQQVRAVRDDFDAIVADARGVFDLVDQGRRDEAAALAEGGLEDRDIASFEETTEAAVASDRERRQVVRGRAADARQTAQLVLALAAVGTISLILLIAAYLASDLFAPLRAIERGLGEVERGDLDARLDERRGDELGAIQDAFNRMTEALRRRQQVAGLAALPTNGDGSDDDGDDFRTTPSRLMLHGMLAQLRSRVGQLGRDEDALDAVEGDERTEERRTLVAELDRISYAVGRLADFGMPLDLNLARTDVRALLYEVLLRFHDDFAQRAISFELDIAPNVGAAIVDRLKLREALGELVRNGLAALPERGGRMGLRASVSADGVGLVLEVADNGAGAEQPLINAAFAPFNGDRDGRTGVGLTLTKAIVEQHGGQLKIDGEPGRGTHVVISLPLRH